MAAWLSRPYISAGGGGGVSAGDPNYVGAYIDLSTLTASVPTPVVGNWGMAGGSRFDWSGTAWVNNVTNSIVTVADQAARLAMPNALPNTFQMVRQTTDGVIYMNVVSPASDNANWIPITNESTVQPPVLEMGEPAKAGQVVKIAGDGKGYLAIANSYNTPNSVPPVGTWPVTPDYGGVGGIMGLASADAAIGASVDLALVSLTCADWSGATHNGAATLVPGTRYALHQLQYGKLIPFGSVNYDLPGGVIQGIGYALDANTLVLSQSQLFN